MSRKTESKKKEIIKPKVQANIGKQPLIPEKYQDLVYILGLVGLLFAFFAGNIFTGSLLSEDAMASKSFLPFYDAAARDGIYPLWIPNIFGGMPGFSAFVLNADRYWDIIALVYFKLTHYVGVLFANDSARVVSYYIFFAVGIFYLIKDKLNNRSLAFLTAVAATFSTEVIVWAMIGHNTKPIAFSMLPFAFIFVEKLREKFSLKYFALLTIVIHILFASNHVQMTFYAGLALGIYLLFELASRLISKDNVMGVVRAGLLLLVASAMAFMMSSDKYLSVLDYTEYSTRGSAPIVQDINAKITSNGGQDYAYATGWSFSPAEVMDMFVPNYHGFGQSDYSSAQTQGQTYQIMTYWGQKPFTDVAPYFGIFILFFALFGFIMNRKDIFVQFLAFLSFIVLLLSFGNTMPILYDFFYYNIPMFDKFRAPSMILAMLSFTLPILSAYALGSILKWNKEYNNTEKKYMKAMLFTAVGFVVAGVLFALAFKDSYFDAMANSTNQYFINMLGQIPDLKEFVWGNMMSDWFINGAILIIAVLLIYPFIKNKISRFQFVAILLLLLMLDLGRVSSRRLEEHDKIDVSQLFPQKDYYNFIKQDNSLFRIADFSTKTPNSAAFYGLESIGGYSAAKMRNWQDLSDYCDQGSTSLLQNPFLWSLFNLKYLVLPQEMGMQPAFVSADRVTRVYEVPERMQRAEFVNSFVKADRLEIIEHIKKGDFNPHQVAYVEEDLAQIDALIGNEKVKITKHGIHQIEIETENSGNNLLVISEMYYPNWHAYIGDKEIPIYKTNFAFRSIIVPQGKNKIIMKYEDPAFKLGKSLSMMSNILVIILLFAGIFLERKKKIIEK